jgi:hypothetical protein
MCYHIYISNQHMRSHIVYALCKISPYTYLNPYFKSLIKIIDASKLPSIVYIYIYFILHILTEVINHSWVMAQYKSMDEADQYIAQNFEITILYFEPFSFVF